MVNNKPSFLMAGSKHFPAFWNRLNMGFINKGVSHHMSQFCDTSGCIAGYLLPG